MPSKTWSMAVWAGTSWLGLMAFATLCAREARRGEAESSPLRVYWVLQLLAWAEPLYNDLTRGSDERWQLPPVLLYCACGALLVVGSFYVCFAARARYDPSCLLRTRRPGSSNSRGRRGVNSDGL